MSTMDSESETIILYNKIYIEDFFKNNKIYQFDNN